jgi:hypothetical protein
VAARKESLELFQMSEIEGCRLCCKCSRSGFAFEGSAHKSPRVGRVDRRGSSGFGSGMADSGCGGAGGNCCSGTAGWGLSGAGMAGIGGAASSSLSGRAKSTCSGEGGIVDES